MRHLNAQDADMLAPKPNRLVVKHVGLDQDEQVILLIRKHWVVFRNTSLLMLFCPFVLLFCVYFISQWPLGWSDTFVHLVSVALYGISAICFILGGLTFLWRFYLWRHTFYVMTNKKLAIINQFKPWHYEVQQINLNHINDVTLKQNGLEAFLYGYSDIISITYSGSVFTFTHVDNATEVQKSIMQQLAKQKRVNVAEGEELGSIVGA